MKPKPSFGCSEIKPMGAVECGDPLPRSITLPEYVIFERLDGNILFAYEGQSTYEMDLTDYPDKETLSKLQRGDKIKLVMK